MHTHRTSFSFGRLAAAAVLAAAVPVQAGILVQQDITVTWTLDDPGDGIPAVTGTVNPTQTGGGTLTANPTVPHGSASVTLNLTFDPAQGTLRSGSQLSTFQNGLTQSPGWQDLRASSFNIVSFDDLLSVDDNGFGFIKIFIQTSGSFQHNNSILEPPDSYSPVSTFSLVSVQADTGGVGDAGRFDDSKSRFHNCLGDRVCSINEVQNVSNLMELIVPWEQGVLIPFNFAYFEQASADGDVVDASSVTMDITNNFGHTLQLFANVYNSNFNLLQGVQVTSANGINYQNFGGTPGPAPVPEPGTMGLLGMALAGTAVLRRK